jgi:hypothetical protein
MKSPLTTSLLQANTDEDKAIPYLSRQNDEMTAKRQIIIYI